MATLFTKIINGEIPCYKIAENDKFLAFLDVNPNVKGTLYVFLNRKLIKFLRSK